jgi:hypothetical protein
MYPRRPLEPNALAGKTVDTERRSPRRMRFRYPPVFHSLIMA